MSQTIRIGVLISGSGTNLQAIIDSCESGKINGKVVFVGSDNPAAGGLERGHRKSIPTFVVDYASIIQRFKNVPADVKLPSGFDLNEALLKQSLFPTESDYDRIKEYLITRAAAEAELFEAMQPYPFDLLVLAGFMRNLTPYFIDKVNTDPNKPRIMNIHPSLLPAFPGTDGYGDTFQHGCKVGGCTVHFVDYGIDSGPIIAQEVYKIDDHDTIDTIKKKGLRLEWKLYPDCISLFAEGRLKVVVNSYQLNGKQLCRRVVNITPPQAKTRKKSNLSKKKPLMDAEIITPLPLAV